MFRSIAAFRALAALWVLVAHCMIWGGWYWAPLPSAKFAVDLFMMISGFLMVAQSDARHTTEPLIGTRNRWRFWSRRFFRLAPAYYLSLLLATASASLFLGGYEALRALNPLQWQFDTIYDPALIDYSAKNLLLHFSFLFGFLPEWSFSTMLPDWSLGLEMQFYAAFPLLMLCLNRLGVGALVAVGFVSAWVGWHVHSFHEPSLLVLNLHHFLAGMLIFRAKRMRTCALAVALTALDGSPVPPLLAVALMVAVHFESIDRLPAFFASRLVAFGSDCSYSVYLFHGFFISACGLAVSHSAVLLALSPAHRVAGMLAFVLSASYVTAWAMFRWVELPGIELGRRVTRGSAFRPAPTERY